MSKDTTPAPAKKVTIYLPPELAAEVETAAERDDRSVSNFVKWCVQRALRDR